MVGYGVCAIITRTSILNLAPFFLLHFLFLRANLCVCVHVNVCVCVCMYDCHIAVAF